LHADEATVLEPAGVDQRHVADGDALADPGIAAPDAGHVYHRAVLHVGQRANMDRREVAAEHAAKPDVGACPDLDLTDQRGVRCHDRVDGYLRNMIAKRQDPAAAHDGSASCKPAASGRPSMRLRFCTAAPEAPLPRLSSNATSRACPASSEP